MAPISIRFFFRFKCNLISTEFEFIEVIVKITVIKIKWFEVDCAGIILLAKAIFQVNRIITCTCFCSRAIRYVLIGVGEVTLHL